MRHFFRKQSDVPFLYRKVLLTEKTCDEILEEFIKNEQLQKKVDNDSKNSTDIPWKFSRRNTNILLSKSTNYIWDTLQIALHEYTKLYPTIHDLNLSWGINDSFNFQYYNPGQGFPNYHTENLPFLSRFLVWTLYLSNTFDGGTQFRHYNNHIEKCKPGKMVIFPANWTFSHRSQISYTTPKFLATGWLRFDNIKQFNLKE